MIVALDATSIGSGLGGDETLVTGLLRGLVAELHTDDRVRVLAATGATLPAEAVADHRVEVDRRPRRPGVWHFTVELPRWLRGLAVQPDVVLTNTHAPLWSPAPVALMLPDLSFVHRPEAYPRGTRWRLQALVGRQAARAGVVLTISEFSRQDLITTYGLTPTDVHTVPLVVDPPLDHDADSLAAARRRLADRGAEGDFLLYLGNLHPRKNVARAIRSFTAVRSREQALADHRFVVAGGRWFSGSDEEAAAAAAPEGSVVFVGRVDDAEREVLLRDAQALVYISEFEGFGLPPLEAMARDTPVLAADATAVPEVCGDAAILVGPRDDAAIEAGLVTVLTDDARRSELVTAGRRRVGTYDVARTGAALRAALDHVVGARPAVSVSTP